MSLDLKVLFLPTSSVGVAYWRMFTFFEWMKEKGDINPAIYGMDWSKVGSTMDWYTQLLTGSQSNEDIYKAIMASHIVVLEYVSSPILIALTIMFRERFNKIVLCEIDDYIVDVPNYNWSYQNGFKAGNEIERATIEHMKVCDGVICSTRYMADQYAKYNRHTTVVPNSIDFSKWEGHDTGKKHKNIRIGWIGAANHDDDLKMIKNVITTIVDKYTNVEFRFVHGVPQFIKDMKSTQIKFSDVGKWVDIRDYPKFLASKGFDIGLAPVVDNKFNRCKTNIKWLELASQKIPCVASDLITYNHTIKHGKTGLLASTEEDWINNLSSLIEDKTFRETIGKNAYEQAKREYSVEVIGKRYVEFLKEIYKNGQSRFKNRNQSVGAGYRH